MIDMMKWECVKNKIHERLLSSEWHAQQLNHMVKVGVSADIWRTWYVDLGDLLGSHSITAVTYALMQEWGVTMDDIESASRENDTGKYTIRNLGAIISDMIGAPAPDEDGIAMYVISNVDNRYGAAGTLDAGIQRKLSEIFPDGYYILPSSVHECIAVSSEMAPDELVSMVRTINRSEVAEQERLSDHVFRIENGKLAAVA